jgi:hypothetical protein
VLIPRYFFFAVFFEGLFLRGRGVKSSYPPFFFDDFFADDLADDFFCILPRGRSVCRDHDPYPVILGEKLG